MGGAAGAGRLTAANGVTSPQGQGEGPGPVASFLGRLINNVVVRSPRLWPLLRKPVERFFDKAAPGWDNRMQARPGNRLAPLEAALSAIERTPTSLLEVGTGTGAGAFMLAERFPEAEILGIDIATQMVRIAAAKAAAEDNRRLRFVAADVTKLDPGEGTFDLVAMVNMPPFFDNVSRLVAPGGYVAWASSRGSRTPFFTKESVLRRGFERRGLRTVAAGAAGGGTYYLAERPEVE
jgi:SAM-dependent methyltransferase